MTTLFKSSQRTAITVEADNSIILWIPAANGEFRKFSDDYGACILASDRTWFDRNAKAAQHCKYAELWLGEFPYSSFCWGVRKCKTTGKVQITQFSTDINPRGITSHGKWEQECLAYVPEMVMA